MTGCTSSTGSPAPITSYSRSTPLTFTLCMGSSSFGAGGCGPQPICVSKTVTAVTPTVTAGARSTSLCSACWRAMTDAVGEAVLQRARDAASRGDWGTAFELFMKADADGLAGPADLGVLGEVAYAAGHLDVTIEAWERAYALCVEAGDTGRGGRCGGSRGDAPALRYRADGAGAGLAGTSRAAPGRSARDTGERLACGGSDV